MSLSFGESLAKNVASENINVITEEANEENIIMETPSVMAYSLRSASALSSSGGWTPIDDKGYRFYNDEYSDENYSTVDELKNIVLDSKQINITQEQNSQYIPFQMPRYYDGFDLIKTKLEIYYVNKNKKFHSDTPVDVYYNDEYIRFAWLVSEFATQVSGILQFEIRAKGVNDKNEPYTWKSKSIDKLNVLQSLEEIAVEEIGLSEEEIESWYNKIETKTQEAQNAAESARASASRAETLVAQLEDGISQEVEDVVNNVVTPILDENINEKLKNYYLKTETYSQTEIDEKIDAVKPEGYATIEYVDEQIKNIDVTEQLDNYALKTDVTSMIAANPQDFATKQEVADAIAAEDITTKLGNYYTKEDTYSKTEVNELLDTVEVDLTGYATESYVNTKTNALSSSISDNTDSITGINSAITTINQTIESIDKSPRVTYKATYGDVELDDGTTAEYMFTLWKNEGNGDEVQDRFQIMGGGGNTSSVILSIAYVDGYTTPLVSTVDERVIVKYNFSGEDSAGDTNLDGIASWKVGNRIVATEDVATGECEFDLTDYVVVGDNKVVLTITHATGAVATKAWTVKVVDVRLESTFDDTKFNIANEPVVFTFTPYGGVAKTIYFLLDGKEIGKKTSSAAAAGLSDSFTVPAQSHGTHLFEAYMTADINGKTIESNHIVKDIIWYDESSTIPVISCTQQEFTIRQYEAVNINYTVYDPSTETPNISLKSTYINENGEIVEEYNSNITMSSNTATWQYKTDVIGKHTLTITCGEVVKTLIATVVELGISVSPITTGLVFDFNPVGYSNNDVNRLWSDNNIAMTVSDNFDWVNGGYQYDENGDQCFCIKSGTSAEINYELFGDDAKANGKEFKLIFKTRNVSNADATFLSCVSDTIGTDKIGLEMKVHEAKIYAKTDSLPLPYAEEEIIEFEFNISASTETPSMVMGYEDGVSTRPLVYDDTHDFQQVQGHRKTIALGSDECDLYIYRFKVYNKSLSDKDVLNNFIADARSAEEMIERYDRNQIYKEGILDPDYLAEMCPQLKIIKLEVPHFTNDKDDKVYNKNIQSIVECVHKGGDPIYDNWVAYDIVHSGQGTSSNNYGAAGRNLDIIMKSYKDYGNAPYIILGDGSRTDKITLTRESIPTNYLNAKVNIASSENANNALFAKRYNQYNPYNRPFVREDEFIIPYIKDTMEFQNCVIFVKESDTDLTTHREFNDNEWHFYAIGNIGDSKKTDKTRLTDPTDQYECVLEVMDNTLPNSTMPTGKVDEKGNPIYPISPSEWTVGNSAYDSLYADKFDEKAANEKDNGLADTYGWRYIYEDGTDEENDQVKAYVEQKWKDFYKFIVTSTDEEFKSQLGNWVVLDSIMYYYLFTLRYTLTDNHSKNSFWHYSKSNDLDSEGNPIRKWDLCFGYDFDKVMSK